MNRSETPTAADVREAADRIRPYVRRTPLLDVEIEGRRMLLKLEHLQRSGSFKLRGAVNALLGAGPTDHVVAASGGNHGLAVATAAELLGVKATIYVPENAPAAKARRIEAAGARLVRHGATFTEAAALARDTAAEKGCLFLHAYDDPAVVAGQGTAGVEIIADAPGVDTLVVATGGGGLAAGTALAADGRRLVTVEPEHCQCLHDALAEGEPVDSAAAASPASIATDLELARSELGVLREERDRLKAAVQRGLGQQVGQVGHGELVARINELTAANQELADKLSRTEADRDSLRVQLTEAQDDLIAARQALRNMMRDQNRAHD